VSADTHGRREYLFAVVLIALGALISWWALSQPWLIVTESLLGVSGESDPALGAASSVVESSGAGLLPLAAAMPVLMLAGIAGVIGSSGWGRRVVGALIAIAAFIMVISVVQGVAIQGLASFAPGDPLEVRTDSFPTILIGVGALCAIAGAVMVAVAGPRWPSLGRSYERAGRTPRDAWDALDQGIDPTEDAHEDPPASDRPGGTRG